MNTNEPQILMTRKHLAKADHVSSTGITQRPRSESPQNNIRGFPRFIQWSVHFTQIALYRLGVLHDSREPLPTFPPPPASTYRMTNRASLRRLTRFLGGGYTP